MNAQFSEAQVANAIAEAPQAEVVTTEAVAEAQVADVQVAIQQIALLGDKVSQKEMVQKINEIISAVNLLVERNKVPAATVPTRNRGPVSEKQMTEADAMLIMVGDMKDSSHKECATKLGLSYGQVYSARKGFTFKAIYKMAIANGKSW